MKASLRLQHKSYRTEKTYLGWLRRFYLFVDGKVPDDLVSDDVRRFLSYLARYQFANHTHPNFSNASSVQRL